MSKKYMNFFLQAFSLAEALLTFTIIGIIATLVMSSFGVNIRQSATKQKLNAQIVRLHQGFETMRIKGVFQTRYASTEDFVNAMQKYLNVSQICKNNELNKCFSEKVLIPTTINGRTVYEEKNIDEVEDIDKIVGIKLSDGTSMLIKYNTEGTLIYPWDNSYSAASNTNTEATDIIPYPEYGNLFTYLVDVNGGSNKKAQGSTIGNMNLGSNDKQTLASNETSQSGSTQAVQEPTTETGIAQEEPKTPQCGTLSMVGSNSESTNTSTRSGIWVNTTTTTTTSKYYAYNGTDGQTSDCTSLLSGVSCPSGNSSSSITTYGGNSVLSCVYITTSTTKTLYDPNPVIVTHSGGGNN